jgi:hypothetical protein
LAASDVLAVFPFRIIYNLVISAKLEEEYALLAAHWQGSQESLGGFPKRKAPSFGFVRKQCDNVTARVFNLTVEGARSYKQIPIVDESDGYV